MTDSITLTGFVGSDPKHFVTSEGLAITSFRLASSQRRFDRSKNAWVDGDTNWYSVTAFRQLANNTFGSVQKGNAVVVTGRLRVRVWEAGGRKGINVDVEADAIGHDLTWGTAAFSRTTIVAAVPVDPAPSDTGSVDPLTVDPLTGEVAAGWEPTEPTSDQDDDAAEASEEQLADAVRPF